MQLQEKLKSEIGRYMDSGQLFTSSLYQCTLSVYVHKTNYNVHELHYKIVGIVRRTVDSVEAGEQLPEKSVYFQDENGQQYRRAYAGIVDVELPEAYKMIFVWSDGERWEIPSSGKWNTDLGLENFRLFLLVMAKMLGD